jgi:hypothetical protein
MVSQLRFEPLTSRSRGWRSGSTTWATRPNPDWSSKPILLNLLNWHVCKCVILDFSSVVVFDARWPIPHAETSSHLIASASLHRLCHQLQPVSFTRISRLMIRHCQKNIGNSKKVMLKHDKCVKSVSRLRVSVHFWVHWCIKIRVWCVHVCVSVLWRCVWNRDWERETILHVFFYASVCICRCMWNREIEKERQ